MDRQDRHLGVQSPKQYESVGGDKHMLSKATSLKKWTETSVEKSQKTKRQKSPATII